MTIIKCTVCRKDYTESDFDYFRGKRNNSCKKCREKNNLWYAQDLHGKRSKAKDYYQRNVARIAIYRKRRALKRKYALTVEEVEKMRLEQNNKCAICENEFIKYKPCVDHNHLTGKIRKLLCRKCNLNLHAIENKEFVEKAIAYLKVNDVEDKEPLR